MSESAMGGWKTKLGGACLFLGVLLTGTADRCPAQSAIPWLHFLGVVFTAAGSGMGLVGIGHKIEKMGKEGTG